ncbi:protein containing planctomycete cytochrome C domain protein [Rhodopirellula baltica SH28]|uniref:Protein containing planctomycete cytochrome C domain protein n=1 Tax=Rhodopirellula baltica SH28 TaxID=993517 RepID=K5CJT6_RHOBT|nr:protein containing planctomycete cytochrome C domain protein [Rhodopirellula baltica SH28]
MAAALMSSQRVISVWMHRTVRYVAGSLVMALFCVGANADGLNPRESFFEEKVRPLLIEHCYECHGDALQESDLRLDSLGTILQGGISGPAAVAKNVNESLIIDAVLGRRGMEMMPPDGPLEEDQIVTLRRWINMGLPWPANADDPEDSNSEGMTPALGDQQAIGQVAKSHWAFQPLQKPKVPTTSKPADQKAKHQNQPAHPIDAFVASSLERNGLTPGRIASREVIVRRLHFDLIGLPPTFSQVQAFVNDERDMDVVVAEWIETLLSDQHHGERWARYWLDLARYGDTRDWQAQAELRYPYAYTYRDYVIESLNKDKPYDQFVREQIAADFYAEDADSPSLAALGFLTVGPRFRNNRLEQIADKIDVVGRGLMGITVSCARCHDHKYDPIPTEDYYSLYGVFASCDLPETLPRIETEVSFSDEMKADFQAQLTAKQNELSEYKADLRMQAIADLKKQLPKYLDGFYLLSIARGKDIRGVIGQLKIKETAMTPLNTRLAADLKNRSDISHSVLGPWNQALSANKKQFETQLPRWMKSWAANEDLNPLIRDGLIASNPKTQRELIAAYAGVMDDVLQAWKATSKSADAKNDHRAIKLADPDQEAIRQLLMAEGGWFDLDVEAVARASRLLGKGRKELGDREKAIAAVESTHPAAPPRAMVLVDAKKPVNPFVLLRGEANRRGDRVPRQFLSLLSNVSDGPFTDGSGRRELAEAITSAENPLTARVLVNRVWARYSGRGLVDSLDDFGLRSSPPSHPELLDWLASEFIEQGWSMKWLHRTITTSHTYQQSSDLREDAFAIDPENRWLWRQNRRRLDFEAMRDSIVSVAGTIDLTVGGRSVKLSETPYTTRRSLYAYVDRLELDPILRTFDFASPTASAASRAETTIPQQALFFMNHPFVAEQSRELADRIADEVDDNKIDAATITALYRRVFSRDPSADEITMAKRFLVAAAEADGQALGRVWRYGWGNIASKPKRAGDPADDFMPLPYWSGKAYQASEAFPDPKLKFLRLSATAAHCGVNPAHSIIRRWVAPADGAVRIASKLTHARPNGDGITVSIRSGDFRTTDEVARGTINPSVARLSVKAGDVIDFVASPGANSNSDSHTWTITIAGIDGELNGDRWQSQKDFAPPAPQPLGRADQLAQALMLTNEFLYLD